MENIIEQNLKLMRSSKKGGMEACLSEESIGGNAGRYNEQPCAGANFFYDKENGKIIRFGNWGCVPKEISLNYAEGTFRVIFHISRIVETFLEDYTAEEARITIEKTVAQFNQLVLK